MKEGNKRIVLTKAEERFIRDRRLAMELLGMLYTRKRKVVRKIKSIESKQRAEILKEHRTTNKGNEEWQALGQ